MESPFLWTVCQVGAEPALKREIAREHPELKFAYSRPGFVTFKAPTALAPDFELHSVFARAYGISIGKTRDPGEIAKYAATLPAHLTHVFERDQYFPGDEPPDFVRGRWAEPARAALLGPTSHPASQPSLVRGSAAVRPTDGDLVLDVIAVEPQEWWFGLHTHSDSRSADPGGRPEIPMPAEAPSRAYIKLEEALRRTGAPLTAGQVAVEIGSAPGGASFALLERGLTVIGIDPGEMAPAVLRHPRFKHIALPVARVARETLPERVDWLLLDMNVAPSVSLFSVDRLAHRLLGERGGLQGLLLTVKLNEWQLADEIPAMLEHVRAIGFREAYATQLAHQRQEILIYATSAVAPPLSSRARTSRAHRSRG
jgi:23S rRNA (cytidine2498-2'-O)-methyltransferase